MIDYLGKHVSQLLEREPFSSWPVERIVDDDLDERRVDYIFEGNGLSLICDQDDKVSTVFLYADEYGGFRERLFEVPMSLNRRQVLDHFGPPAKSGGKTSNPILGELGPWDRFLREGAAVHVEYRPDADVISKITLMRSDVVP